MGRKIMRKNSLRTEIAAACLLGLLVLSGCNSGTAEDTELRLAGNTFHLELSPTSADISENCPPHIPFATIVIHEEGLVADGPQALHNSDGYADNFQTSTFTITFEGDGTFVMGIDGNVDDEGEWQAIDGDTIEITISGDSGLAHIDIEGDTLIMELTPESAGAICGHLPESIEDFEHSLPPLGENENENNPSNPEESVVAQQTLTNFLDGTWCYESGYVFYLALVIDAGTVPNPGYAVYKSQAAPQEDNDDFLDGTATTLNYATRDVGINEFQQTAWVDTNRSNGTIYSLARITVEPVDPDIIDVEFGAGKDATFVKSDSEVSGECPDLAGNP